MASEHESSGKPKRNWYDIDFCPPFGSPEYMRVRNGPFDPGNPSRINEPFSYHDGLSMECNVIYAAVVDGSHNKKEKTEEN